MTTPPWQARVLPFLEDVMQAYGVPGFVLARQAGSDPVEVFALGADAAGVALTPATWLPVASITKLATALAVLRLAANGAIALDDPLVRHLPRARAAVAGVTLRSLLSHTSGLPGDLAPAVAPYAPGLDWPALARGCLATPLVRAPGTRVHYSNVGIGLLAIVVERHTAQPFAVALEELVLGPLGIEGYLGPAPPQPPARIAGDFGEHAGSALEPINSPFWRSLALPWGGLVTTAAGALRLVGAFGGQPAGFLPPALLTEATSDQSSGLPGGFFPPLTWPHCAWGLGVELRGAKEPHWLPASASPASFGHVGSTGCLAWYEPGREVAWVMCGLRVFVAWWQAWAAIGEAIAAD